MLEAVKIAAEKNGGLVKLAELLSMKHQSFYSWEKVPAERVLDLERLSGVARHKLRPDIYPAPASEPERAA